MYRNYDKISLEKIKKYSEIISLTSKSGYNLLENLLQWSRSQTGTIAYTPLKLQLAVVVEETLDLLTAAAEKKNIVINQNISPEIWVYADEGMLMTILRNLISNAIKFTPEGGTITLNAKEKDFMVEISVSDTGVGITPDAIEKIFRIDVNYTTKGTNNESGTGLGLIVCKEFVEKHEGKIWVISEVNKGSTFFFTLPIG